MRRIRQALLVALSAGTLAGCGAFIPETGRVTSDDATLMSVTSTGLTVEGLPPPARPIDVAVYAFPDRTGQNESDDDVALFSQAVTQGGADLLTDVLVKAGRGQWFNVVERAGVDNLLRERAIIEQTQAAFKGAVSLAPLRFAGILIEGSIVGYDTNYITGGDGARFLGIGAFSMYREDIVTVALRAVSVSSGRVLTSATTTKTIYSVQWQAGVFRYVAVDEILEYETGFSRNEPEIFATREAMELAVLSMIVEGASEGQWAFADAKAGEEVLQSYRRRYELGRLGYTFKEMQEMEAQNVEAETEGSLTPRLQTQASAVDVGTKGEGEDQRLMRAALQHGPR